MVQKPPVQHHRRFAQQARLCAVRLFGAAGKMIRHARPKRAAVRVNLRFLPHLRVSHVSAPSDPIGAVSGRLRGDGPQSRGDFPTNAARDALALAPPPVVTPDDAAQHARVLLGKLARSRAPGESVKGAIGRVAGLAGLGYERTREIWYGRAKLLAWELMQIEQRVARRDAQVARLLDRMAGITDSPGVPARLTWADAAALAEYVPEAASWARGLGLAARALVLACLLSTLVPIIFQDHAAQARTVKRGGPPVERTAPKGGWKPVTGPKPMPKIPRPLPARGGARVA